MVRFLPRSEAAAPDDGQMLMLPAEKIRRSWADAAPVPFWLDRPHRPAPRPRLTSSTSAELAVVGGGFSGLWTALLAKERDPGRDVILVEGGRIASAASGRNGGFCDASLTHGEANGRARFPVEAGRLDHLGLRNLDELEATVNRYGIACDFERTGALSVATQPYQAERLEASGADVLDLGQVRAEVNSPTYLAGVWDRGGCALVDPARLAWGLAEAAESLGVRIAEHTHVAAIGRSGRRLTLQTRAGPTITADHVALGTNAFPSLIRRIRWHTVPVYDYVLVSEPLSARQLESVGWHNRQGVDDLANQFHYYRLTADNRILWGGYDAIYHFGRKIKPSYDQRPATFHRLATHFFSTFPQLEGIRFTHRWGGAIDTCTRFCAFFGTAFAGRVAYAAGYTGLGVGATRFGASVMLDLLAGEHTERTELAMVRSRPLPFPPEPLAFLGIQLTRWSLDQADRKCGSRNAWLRTLDRIGVGYDS
jgi:glycine/D-amino acid oxidase-like deaminating enzyme